MILSFRLCILLSFLFFIQVQGQESSMSYFQDQEKLLLSEYNQISKLGSEESIKEKQEKFFNHLFKVVKQDQSWLYPFDSLKYIGRVISSNEKMVVYTWNFPKSFGYSDYYGIIQYIDKRGKDLKTYRLNQLKEKVEDPFLYICDTNKWIGALYYQIVETKYKGTECYTLLGYNFSDVLSNKKVLDAICVGKQGNLRFEPNMFFYNNKVCNRLEFEFAENAQMMLDYKPLMKKIVFDHLSPIRPSLKGQNQFYGPDASYDALYFEDGVWQHESDVLIED